MSYQILIHPQAVDFLNNLPLDLKTRIKKKLKDLQTSPFHFLEHFEGDYYKLRIGDYRALIDVDFKKKLILVQVIDHRSRIYKNQEK